MLNSQAIKKYYLDHRRRILFITPCCLTLISSLVHGFSFYLLGMAGTSVLSAWWLLRSNHIVSYWLYGIFAGGSAAGAAGMMIGFWIGYGAWVIQHDNPARLLLDENNRYSEEKYQKMDRLFSLHLGRYIVSNFMSLVIVPYTIYKINSIAPSINFSMLDPLVNALAAVMPGIDIANEKIGRITNNYQLGGRIILISLSIIAVTWAFVGYSIKRNLNIYEVISEFWFRKKIKIYLGISIIGLIVGILVLFIIILKGVPIGRSYRHSAIFQWGINFSMLPLSLGIASVFIYLHKRSRKYRKLTVNKLGVILETLTKGA